MKNRIIATAFVLTFLLLSLTVLFCGCSSNSYHESSTSQTESEKENTNYIESAAESTEYIGNYSYNYSYSTRRNTTSSYTYTTTEKSYYNYGGYSYSTTAAQTYKQDDPYYRANDYNNDGKLNQEEFQGAVNDWMDAHGY